MKKDRLVGMVLGIISIAFLIMTYMLPKSKYSTAVGPEVFPYFAAGGLLLCALGLIFQREDPKKAKAPFLDKKGWLRVLRLGGLLALFPVIFIFLGFIVAAFALLFAMIRMFDAERKVPLWKNAAVSGIITVFLYGLFTYLLKIQLPQGAVLDFIKG